MPDRIISMSIYPTDSGFSELIGSLEAVSTRYLPNTVKAVQICLKNIIEHTWKCYAMGSPVHGTSIKIKNVGGGYAKSIKTVQSSPFSGMVFSDSPYAGSLEDDREQTDLKKIIPLGKKSRIWVGKDGQINPYTIVPFRHGTPGSLSSPMPETFYNQLKRKIKALKFKKSKVEETTYRSSNANLEGVERATYTWKGRVKPRQAPELNLAGLVVMDVSTRAKNRSEFVTFRIITLNKPKVSKAQKGWENSWVVPARAGMHLSQHVARNTAPIVAETLAAGMLLDMTP